MTKWYREDLAYIHDKGHGEFALKAAPGILTVFHQHGIDDGLVVDLGCGSGLWARELRQAGYQVLGIDISESMIEIARRRVPDAEFRVASFFTASIPACAAVTSVGECLNYLFAAGNNQRGLSRLFARIHRALLPGGIFVFDIAEPGQVPSGAIVRSFSAGDDWLVAVEKSEDRRRAVLTRKIISFRETSNRYRRDEEVHRQQLHERKEVALALRDAGFTVRQARSYGAYQLPRAHSCFIARKRSKRQTLGEPHD